jgi:tRNA nucleotidyltransferase/poly(A) polymerase
MWDIIPSSIKELHNLFKSNGKSLYLVGGSVRDFLNKETPKDYDLATDATPDEILLITKDYKNHLHGESFGVVVVYTEDTPEGFEIATFRSDIYGDKLGETRNPDVIFTTIDKDVLRRDLTYNALFYDLDKQEVIDLVGGVEDIKNKITRFVGEPELRIMEDPLRILRLIRFTTRYGFTIEEKSLSAIIINGESLNIIKKERIWEEVKKAFEQSDFKAYMELLVYTGVIYNIFKYDGLFLNTKIVECSTLEFFFANLFKLTSSTEGLLDIMKFSFKMEHNFARKVVFFIELLKLKPENSLEIFKKRDICKASTDELLEWYTLSRLRKSKTHTAFLYFKPTVKANPLKEKGFKDRALGAEIKRLELENFNKIVNEI